MTHGNGAPTEWTTSRIMRLLRPLKSKCIRLSTYMKEMQMEPVKAYGSRRRGWDQELLPLEIPSNIGIRIHFSRDTVQTIELAKKIYAIRDCYYDISSKDNSAIAETSNTPTLTTLSSICSVILGAQIHREDEEAEEDTDSDVADVLYEVIPPQYRLRTLLMHALHLILDACPPNACLYLSLLDITLEHRLYHESEVLLDAILEYAFEASQNDSPRVSNPAYRRFLVDLYSDWSSRFSSHAFVRLVTDALQRATSDTVWISKATRRLVRKLVRYDTGGLPILLAGIMDAIYSRKETLKPTHHLETQLREWLHSCTEICIMSMTGTSQISISMADQAFVSSILDCYRSCLSQSENHEALSIYAFTDGISCLYSLWIVSGSRSTVEYDLLSTHLRNLLPPSSTFAPICSHVLRTNSLDDSEDIFFTFATTFRVHQLPRLRASLWACALDHVENPEMEQTLVQKHGKEIVRSFKMRLLEYADKAEKRCFAVSPHVVAHRESKVGGDLQISYTGRDSGKCSSHTGWSWDASLGSWFRRDEHSNDNVPATPKRRKKTQGSYLSPHRPSLLDTSPHLTFETMVKKHKRDLGFSFAPINNRNLPPTSYTLDGAHKAPHDFFCLLSKALSSRTSLHSETRNTSNHGRSTATVDKGLDIEDCDESDADSDNSDSWGMRTSDIGDHTPSEDNLDLFKIANTSPLISR